MCAFGICKLMRIRLCTYELVFANVCRCVWLLIFELSLFLLEYMYVLNWCCKRYLVGGRTTYVPI